VDILRGEPDVRGDCGVEEVGKLLRKFLGSVAVLCVSAAFPLHGQFPKSVVDPASAGRGATIYANDCARCHGADVRGAGTTPDLLRSTMVLHDRRENLRGSELAPYLKSTPPHDFKFNDKQAADLSQFLSQAVNKILRSGYDDHPKQLLSGDAKAGEAYFNGAGGCSKCHSVTGDLQGIGSRYTTATLQQKFLFPNVGIGGKKQPITVTVTMPSGKVYSGDLVRIDDFTVTLRDKDGVSRSLNRTTGAKVKTVDPYVAHVLLLQKYTDTDIHNMTTYLDTVK
jgi:cytochrome c oxidase cbb3-type subunit 3